MDERDPGSRIALALDVPDLDAATALIERTREHVGIFKVGLELYTAVGPAAVDAVHAAGAKCFLDLKLHDIPATRYMPRQGSSRCGKPMITQARRVFLQSRC